VWFTLGIHGTHRIIVLELRLLGIVHIECNVVECRYEDRDAALLLLACSIESVARLHTERSVQRRTSCMMISWISGCIILMSRTA